VNDEHVPCHHSKDYKNKECSHTTCEVNEAGHTVMRDYHRLEKHGERHHCVSSVATKKCVCMCGDTHELGHSRLVHDNKHVFIVSGHPKRLVAGQTFADHAQPLGGTDNTRAQDFSGYLPDAQNYTILDHLAHDGNLSDGKAIAYRCAPRRHNLGLHFHTDLTNSYGYWGRGSASKAKCEAQCTCDDCRCQSAFVPVDGSWGEWGEFSDCTKSCGGGTMWRQRQCDYPPPMNGGADCKGSRIQRRQCNAFSCDRIQVISARYGYKNCGSRGASRLALFRAQCDGSFKCSVRVNNELEQGGDPAEGCNKQAEVTYRCGSAGAVKRATLASDDGGHMSRFGGRVGLWCPKGLTRTCEVLPGAKRQVGAPVSGHEQHANAIDNLAGTIGYGTDNHTLEQCLVECADDNRCKQAWFKEATGACYGSTAASALNEHEPGLSQVGWSTIQCPRLPEPTRACETFDTSMKSLNEVFGPSTNNEWVPELGRTKFWERHNRGVSVPITLRHRYSADDAHDEDAVAQGTARKTSTNDTWIVGAVHSGLLKMALIDITGAGSSQTIESRTMPAGEAATRLCDDQGVFGQTRASAADTFDCWEHAHRVGHNYDMLLIAKRHDIKKRSVAEAFQDSTEHVPFEWCVKSCKLLPECDSTSSLGLACCSQVVWKENDDASQCYDSTPSAWCTPFADGASTSTWALPPVANPVLGIGETLDSHCRALCDDEQTCAFYGSVTDGHNCEFWVATACQAEHGHGFNGQYTAATVNTLHKKTACTTPGTGKGFGTCFRQRNADLRESSFDESGQRLGVTAHAQWKSAHCPPLDANSGPIASP
jgi:hypothetical protein